MDGAKAMEIPVCGANTRLGRTCRRSAGWGTGHVGVGRCKNHGGSTPTHELKAAVEIARAETAKYAIPLDIEPHEAILQMVKLSAGWVQYAFDRVNELEAGELVGPVVTTRPLKEEKGAESSSKRVEEHGAPAVHIWIKVQGEWAEKLVHFSKTAIACGIAERQIAVAEGQAQLLAESMKQLAIALGFNPADPKVRTAMGQSLRLIQGGLAA